MSTISQANGSKENPYLAHLPPGERSKTSTPSTKEPLLGFLARKVNGDQVRRVLVRLHTSLPSVMVCANVCMSFCFKEGDVNAFTKQPHTAAYKKIMEARKKLPVYAQMDEFYRMVRRSTLGSRYVFTALDNVFGANRWVERSSV